MNLQIIGDKSTKKIIAVADDIMERDHNGIALAVLQQIVAHCGLDDRYLVIPASQLANLTCNWTPYALVAETLPEQAEGLPDYRICISDYTGREEPDENLTYHHTTFSTENDGADFVARNMRCTRNDEYAFELVGLGIIGRIHLMHGDAETLRATLTAASAALSCGISFADVVEVLNQLSVMMLQNSRMAR